MSPRSIRLASETSSAAESSGIRPMSRRYMRQGIIGSRGTRSCGCSSGSGDYLFAQLNPFIVSVLEDIDTAISNAAVNLFDLLGSEVLFLQRIRDIIKG